LKPGKKGLTRIMDALGYSLRGLRFAYRYEAAFRQEFWLVVVLAPLALLIGSNALERAVLLGTLFIVLITELLNTAIEATVDRVGDEFHALAGRAKDVASAAVLLSLILTGVVWGLILWERLTG
jgi:diacylglycerol kinase (ATP)